MRTFSEKVVEAARSIPPGRVTTYGRISQACGGGTMAAQSITSILWKAEQSGMKDIPYHRIVYADGKVWINGKYRKTRLKLYKSEGIELDSKDRIKNFRDLLFEFR